MNETVAAEPDVNTPHTDLLDLERYARVLAWPWCGVRYQKTCVDNLGSANPHTSTLSQPDFTRIDPLLNL
ncbi:hypothetical protein RRG08_023078 [Elysia crispata]|uniref:Uncharacterized protein n=1 Tax=Elysia crispata TaxID=231223 RepID=A0AAE1AS39_9GAST|nr:hypothetical protein RRG08_023078 [Elysia crispata]